MRGGSIWLCFWYLPFLSARETAVLDGASQGKGIGRDDAHLSLEVDHGGRVEILGVHDGGVHVGEDLELVRHPDVVAVGGYAVGDGTLAHLLLDQGLDHAMLAGPSPDPMVRLESHPWPPRAYFPGAARACTGWGIWPMPSPS